MLVPRVGTRDRKEERWYIAGDYRMKVRDGVRMVGWEGKWHYQINCMTIGNTLEFLIEWVSDLLLKSLYLESQILSAFKIFCKYPKKFRQNG